MEEEIISIISKILKKITNKHSLLQLQQQTQNTDIQKEEIRMTINFQSVEGNREKLRCILKSHKIRSTFYPESTLRKFLCNPVVRKIKKISFMELTVVAAKQSASVNLNGC